MELIPILSFIILVATISTFILAIGAYILYKVRESKGRIAHAAQPKTVEAELFTPAGVQFRQPESIPQYRGVAYAEQPSYAKPQQEQQVRQPYAQQQQEMHARQQEPGYQPLQQPARFAPPAQQGNTGDPSQRYPQQVVPGQATTDRKFMKYTTDGYVPVDQNKSGENLKWR